MKIIIVGAGEVGFHIADRLSKEGHGVTMVEKDPEKEADLRNKLNALVLSGSGASSEVLEAAGIAQADMFIAVTDLDEVNLIACLLAKDYKVDKIITRIKSLETEWMHNALKLGIDLIINPRQVVADEICNMVTYTAATEVGEFADGRVVFLGYPIHRDCPLAGVSLKTLGAIRGLYRMVVTAITRNGDTIIPRGEDVVQEGDILYFVCNKSDLAAITNLFGFEDHQSSNFFILGGGGVGLEVARRLSELNYRVKLVERDPKRCRRVAQRLEDVHVLNTSGTDVETLQNEGIEQADVFIAVTGDDQANILCSLLAKRYGAKRAIALVNQPELVSLAPSLGVDACISPRLATASAILKYVRRGQVVSMSLVEQSNSEVIELMLSPDSPLLHKPLKSLQVPRGSIIGSIVRTDKVIIPSGDDDLEAGDHIIIFTLPEAVPRVESYFSQT